MRTVIIDDEPLAILELKNMLERHSEIQVVSSAETAEDALVKIKEFNPELIFLDINMPGKSGFDLLEELDYSPSVIFVTAYDEFAIKAFEINALDYILKPVSPDRLASAINKINKQKETLHPDQKLSINKRIFIKDGEKCYFVALSDIYLIETVGNYARIYYQDKKPLLHKSLNYLEEKLPSEFFFRTDRQHIININFIKNILPYFNSTLQIELNDGTKVEISQRQSVKFKDLMGI